MKTDLNGGPAKRLLLLGGNRYNLGSIHAARQAGFLTLVADRNPHAPGLAAAHLGLPIDLFDFPRLFTAIDQFGGIDGVVPLAEAGVRPAAHLAAHLGLPFITPEAAANATSKATMRCCWADLGKYSPDFHVVRNTGEASQAVAKLGSFPVIFKPDRSFGGSRGVSRVETEEQIPAAFDFAKAAALANSDVLVERFVSGTEHSAEVLIWQGRTSVLCIGEKIKSPPPYRVDLSVQYPARLRPAQEAAVAHMCHVAVKALGLTQGVAHVEFVCTPDGPVLFELGARCGGGHTPQISHHVSGINEFVEYCRMACGLAPTQFTPSTRLGADYRFLIFPPGRLVDVAIPESVSAHERILDVGVTVQPGDELRGLQTTSDRAGFVVVLAASLEEASRQADWACRQISVTYADSTVAHACTLTDDYKCLA